MNTCPICKTPLHQIEYHHLTLLQCDTCSGFWFQEGQFRQAKALGFSRLPDSVSLKNPDEKETPVPETEESSLLCPQCETPLAPYNYAYSSDIQLHRCSKCSGIWATHDNLLQIEHLLAEYKESLEEAKSKVMPLMMKVKQQAQEEEQNSSFFRRIFRRKPVKTQPRQPLLDELDPDNPLDEKENDLER